MNVHRKIPAGIWVPHKSDTGTQFMLMPGGILVFVTVANAPSRGVGLQFVPMRDGQAYAFLQEVIELEAFGVDEEPYNGPCGISAPHNAEAYERNLELAGNCPHPPDAIVKLKEDDPDRLLGCDVKCVRCGCQGMRAHFPNPA